MIHVTYMIQNNPTLLRPRIDETINGRDEYENAYYKYEGTKLARDNNRRMLLIEARDHLLNASRSREGLECMISTMQAVELNGNNLSIV